MDTVIAEWFSNIVPPRLGCDTVESAKCCLGLVYQPCEVVGGTQWEDYEWEDLDCDIEELILEAILCMAKSYGWEGADHDIELRRKL